jgi:hypothetical protein
MYVNNFAMSPPARLSLPAGARRSTAAGTAPPGRNSHATALPELLQCTRRQAKHPLRQPGWWHVRGQCGGVAPGRRTRRLGSLSLLHTSPSSSVRERPVYSNLQGHILMSMEVYHMILSERSEYMGECDGLAQWTHGECWQDHQGGAFFTNGTECQWLLYKHTKVSGLYRPAASSLITNGWSIRWAGWSGEMWIALVPCRQNTHSLCTLGTYVPSTMVNYSHISSVGLQARSTYTDLALTQLWRETFGAGAWLITVKIYPPPSPLTFHQNWL